MIERFSNKIEILSADPKGNGRLIMRLPEDGEKAPAKPMKAIVDSKGNLIVSYVDHKVRIYGPVK